MTLSILNNNPGNLRPVGATGGFQRFASPDEGLRALERDLLLKIAGRSPAMKARFGEGYTPTLANLITTWAPSTENDTGGYIRNVAQWTGISPDKTLRPDDLQTLVPAMIRQEGGAKASKHYAQNTQTISDAGGEDADIIAELKRRGLDETGQPLQAQASEFGDNAAIVAELKRRGLDESGQPLNKDSAPSTVKSDDATPLRAITEQLLQGLSGNLADEAADYPLAAFDALIKGRSFDESLTDVRKVSQARLAAQQEEHPILSALANAAGGATSMGAGGAALKTVAPAAATALEAYAKAHPYLTAGGLGGASGAVYGAGAGTEGTRGESALQSGAAGTVGGPALAFLGRNLIAPLAGRVAETAESALAKLRGASSPASNEATNALAEFAPNLQKPGGELFSKTAGQRTQNVEAQRLENNARSGLVTPDAQRAIQAADTTQNREYHAFMDKLAGDGLDKNRDVNALVDGIGDAIEANASNKKTAVDSAYKLARAGGGVKIDSRDIRQGLWKSIADTRRENAYDLLQMPKAKSVIQRLASYSKKSGEGQITAAKLGEMENWRKQATNARISTQDPTERKFLGEMVRHYDSFMERTAADAADIGDTKAIEAFRNAVKERREYGGLFEGNKLVEGIISGEKSIDDTVKDLIGTGSIKGKRQMTENLDVILKASGDSGAAKVDLRQAFTRRIYDKVANGTEADNPNMDRLSAAKLKTELENLFVYQSDFSKKLYGEKTQKEALQALRELRLITTVQPNVKNPSGSGELVGRILNMLAKVPVVGKAAGPVSAAVSSSRRFQEEKAVQSGLSEFQEAIKNYKPRSTFWATAGASAAASPAIQERERK